ncbi:unnamed protein product [Paramecium pentaurelia]|uniref:Uncharacterized protein n=1 Tax=Paramecium pentaurelia TaxID=43138 RepID=A0A8S1UQL0_9CILI|nr:unnamed protein product [Paramecium pentaurelia]
MNFTLEGKLKIDQFLQILKIFSYPIIICDDEKIQFSEIPENQKFNELNKSDKPASFAQINNDFFNEYQSQIRENHLKFAETSCLNIKMQQDVCLLNSQLNYVCCQIPIDIIYKALKPLAQSHIKILKLSFTYLLIEKGYDNKSIQLHFIVGAYSEKGFFTIMKPIAMLQSRDVELPNLKNKLITINYENCKTITQQMKTYPIGITCNVDEISFSPLSVDQEQVDIWSGALPYYNSSFVEEIYGNLSIQSIYTKTYNPILNYSSKVKLDCTIYISPSENDPKMAILYFVASESNVIICNRQQVITNDESKQQGKLFQDISEELLEEIEQISSQFEKKFSQIQITTNVKDNQNSCYDNQPLKMAYSAIDENNNSKMYSTINQKEPLLFIPPKVTGSINDAILDYMTRNSCKQTTSTLPRYKSNYQN